MASALYINKEIQKLRNLLSNRLADELGEGIYGTDKIYLRVEKDEEFSALAQFYGEQELTGVDWVVFTVTLAAYADPSVFDALILHKKNNEHESKVLIGGATGVLNNGFYPTFSTALYLLAGNNTEKRLQCLSYFLGESPLYKNNIVKLVPLKTESPITEHILTIRQDLVHYFFSGVYNIPQFSTEFPAKEIKTTLAWENLVLSDSTLERINELKVWYDHHKTQRADKALSKYLRRGYKCLFTGEPGTGKTLVASLLGKTFGKMVLRVDLSMIISKYIGETEKNLSKIFEASEGKDWILFFDEADALFGKRTETSDAKDRYANQEVSYLLQRVENYDGMVILASNHRENIDDAFTRRFDSIIWFPKPSVKERLQLWTNILKDSSFSYASDIDVNELANKVDVTGAEISNVIRYCTLYTAQAGATSISRELLMKALKLEFEKSLKPFSFK